MRDYIKAVLKNIPSDWLELTTHRLDIYDEKLAKTQFLKQFEELFKAGNNSLKALENLPTAYDYVRLGHPLSSILEWSIAQVHHLPAKNVISFSSKTMPILAILRKNLFEKKGTRLVYQGELPPFFDTDLLQSVYGYQAELKQINNPSELSSLKHSPSQSTIYLAQEEITSPLELSTPTISNEVDFVLHLYPRLGSVLVVNGEKNESYISEIQHVRRRETIAMTPINCLYVLTNFAEESSTFHKQEQGDNSKSAVLDAISRITETTQPALLSSSGLSIQYAIMMGLIHDAIEKHQGKAIKFIVPPNCYGGTNDQARRVAACLENVEIVDLLVDGNHDMVNSLDLILAEIADEDAVPYIIAEIPTNPRVEVPNLINLEGVLSTVRQTSSGNHAIPPVFILDQTFCPNVHFLGDGEILSTVQAISYVSGSKFPSGGLCTAGYCVANEKAKDVMVKIEQHLQLCDNEATQLQVEILAKQLPSMNQRIHEAYVNTRAFVNYIEETLPAAKINFVSEDLAQEGFTPSVFSLDLPAKGDTHEEKEAHKRSLNYNLIQLMITHIPSESKFCVSYGQLNGCYWTIPATTTQGTTKEGDKDYIVRVSLSPNMDVKLHEEVFSKFVANEKLNE